MHTAVRYFSRSGNTKRIAEAIARGANVSAKSVTEKDDAPDFIDVLFLGGAPYANIMAPELRAYAESLSADRVGKVVLFTTSNWSRRTVLALRKMLSRKNIPVDKEYFYAHMLHIQKRLRAAENFGKRKTDTQ